MNKVIPLGLMVSALLTGCGGGGDGGSPSSGGGTSAPKYTWQFVNLYESDRADVGSGCAIFDEVSTLDAGGNKRVIAATKAEVGFTVLIHSSDGAVTKELTTFTDGQLVIDSTIIPDGGYVSLQEVDNPISGKPEVFMFTVQDALMTDLVVNVRQPQIGASCFTGGQFSDDSFTDTIMDIGQETTPQYYQTSYFNDKLMGKEIASRVQVNAPTNTSQKVLVTAFDSYNSTTEEKQSLSYYGFADSTNLYVSGGTPTITHHLTNVGITNPGFSTTDVTLGNDSEVNVLIGNNIYQWQPIYNSSTALSYITGDSSITNWAVDVSGSDSVNTWQIKSLSSFSGSDVNINVNDNVSDLSASVASGALSTSSFTAGDYNMQRTHLRAKTVADTTRSFYQTIFSTPNTAQVFMKSSAAELSVSGSDRLEISLVTTDTVNSDSIKYFMQQSVNLTDILDTTSFPSYSDVNGSISLYDTEIERYKAMMKSNFVQIRDGVN